MFSLDQHSFEHFVNPMLFLQLCNFSIPIKSSALKPITATDDIQSSLNGSLASSVSIVLPTARRGPGRPKMFVSRAQLESLFELGFTCAKVAKMLCMSERTLQRQRSELGLPIGQWLLYSQLND